jgi:hypothetical protein
MAWTNIPLNHITFGLFSGSSPANATVSVTAADLLMFRYKKLANDTIVVDFRIGKAFFSPSNAGVTGITMELNIPFSSVHFSNIGNPSSFNDGGQTYSNDCVIALDPGSLAYTSGCVTVLNEQNHKIVLLVRNVAGTNMNTVGVVGTFGQIAFEVGPKLRAPGWIGAKGKSARPAARRPGARKGMRRR